MHVVSACACSSAPLAAKKAHHKFGVDTCYTSALDCDPLELSFCCTKTGHNPLKVLSSIRERWSICWLVAAAGIHERSPASTMTHKPLCKDVIFLSTGMFFHPPTNICVSEFKVSAGFGQADELNIRKYLSVLSVERTALHAFMHVL